MAGHGVSKGDSNNREPGVTYCVVYNFTEKLFQFNELTKLNLAWLCKG